MRTVIAIAALLVANVLFTGRAYSQYELHADTGRTMSVMADNVRVIDGDTIEADVSMFGLAGPVTLFYDIEARPTIHVVMRRAKIRILGLDAWEMSDPRGPKAKAALDSIIPKKLHENDVAYVRLIPDGDGKKDSFGRLLARVKTEIGDDLNADVTEYMIKHGHGVPYEGK